MLLVIVGDMPIVMSTSEIAANLNVLEFFVTFSKRWASAGVSRHGVMAPLQDQEENLSHLKTFRDPTLVTVL